MPTYEYECPECGKRFEKFQSMTDSPLKTCPECGHKVKRLIGTGSGIILKNGTSSTTSQGYTGESSCSLEATGKTCCGRTSKCGLQNCER